METTTARFTFQRIELATPAGKKFLRRVARDRTAGGRREEWHMMADSSDGWRVSFWRLVPGAAPGDADYQITVETDAVIVMDGRTGEVAPFHDAETVTVPAARRVHCYGSDCRTAAALMADGWALSVQHSAGSANSSAVGLAFLSLEVYSHAGEVSAFIGQTVYRNGLQIIAGPVN
jgi:hypothetical protein